VAVGPRLYITVEEAVAIRAARDRRSRILRNVVASAVEASRLPMRARWIAPVVDDPDYENLYDRFYGVMSDAAILEQLAFAALLTGRGDLVREAHRRLVGTARVWAPERSVTPDYGTTYAISRLFKGLAVAWDLVGSGLPASERRLVRATILDLLGSYWDGWYRQPMSADPSAHTHHAHLEWASLGVAAMAMRDESTEARPWLDAAIEKFRRDLLPHGLADDGAQEEGASFWASTMFYRFLFLDPLRRTEGIDLAAEARDRFPPDVSVAAIAAPRRHRLETEAGSLLLEPDYAQLGYHAPALVALARLHRSPHLQALAAWDPWLGRLHEPGHTLPSGERLRFCIGPYALAWYDPSLPAQLGDERRAFAFPSVGEGYLRAGWVPGGIVVAVKDGRLAVHAGGRPVLVDLTPGRVLDRDASVAAGTAIWHWDPPDLALRPDVVEARPDGGGVIEAAGRGDRALRVELWAGRRLRIERVDGARRSWWAAPGARRDGAGWEWRHAGTTTRLEVVEGRVVRWAARGYTADRRVGYGDLHVTAARDPRRSLTVVEPAPDSGRLVIEITLERQG
jgi:hypothetical protein